MTTNESKLQAKICVAFSHRWTELYASGMLCEINNNVSGRNPAAEIARRKAMGMQPGASDLFLMHLSTGCEVKHADSVYTKSSILRQQEWGRTLANHGGNYIMSHDIDEIMSYFADAIENGKKGMYIINPKWQYKETCQICRESMDEFERSRYCHECKLNF